jgi:hypothetical protein
MIIKIMGIFDIITAAVFYTFVFHGWFSPSIVILHAVYFGVKGGIFALGDFPSKIDIVVGVYMIIVALGVFQMSQLTVIALIWILQKGLFSLVSR